MKSFKELIFFLRYASLNMEELQIKDMREIIVVIILNFKNQEYKEMFMRFLRNEVKAKTSLYTLVKSEFQNDSIRAMDITNFIGRFGVKGNGKSKYEGLRQLIYRYGKFNNVLKEYEEDLWL